MFKKIVLIALVMFPAMAFAQEKIAHLNSADVVTAMPEYKAMTDSMQKQATAFQAEFKGITDEYTKKFTDFNNQQDSLNNAIKLRRTAELDQIRQRAADFQEFAQQEQEKLQQALMGPIYNKLQKAIDDVGKENGFLYILNSQSLLYASPGSVDATPLVKKKLGIQ